MIQASGHADKEGLQAQTSSDQHTGTSHLAADGPTMEGVIHLVDNCPPNHKADLYQIVLQD
jgi:hypothetical protein